MLHFHSTNNPRLQRSRLTIRNDVKDPSWLGFGGRGQVVKGGYGGDFGE